jgi:hypothetical protein
MTASFSLKKYSTFGSNSHIIITLGSGRLGFGRGGVSQPISAGLSA